MVLTEDPTSAHRWAEMLAGVALLCKAADAPRDLVPDLILTDRAAIDADALPNDRVRQAWRAGELGIVRVGEGVSADLCLPADCRSRELRMACTLLAEAVRWRRECQRLRQSQRSWERLALTDALTGLPNRRAWNERLEARAASSDAVAAPLCLALLDLDDFKSINDRFGYTAGDEVLCHVARRLAGEVRDDDYVARLGGDEFALLLVGCEPESAIADVEAWRVAVCSDAPHTRVTACIGAAWVPRLPAGGFPVLFAAADVALRLAKLNGRNRTVVDRTFDGSANLESASRSPIR